jgi:hypothetical protein
VEHVDLGNQDDRCHEKEQPMTQNEIGCEHGQFGDLAEKLSSRLRDGVSSHGVPLSGPESNVGSVALEFTGKGKRHNELDEKALDASDGDHTRQCAGKVEALENKHTQEGDQQEYNSSSVSDTGENTAKLLAAHAE